MSKVDAQRAMREARYAAIQASGPPRSAAARQPAPSALPRPRSSTAATETAPTETVPTEAGSATPTARSRATRAAHTDPDGTGEALCGHRNMGNKSCQRPAGHPEKNHRYK